MSTEALFWAMKQQIPGGPKWVLVNLADWYNKNEKAAWPKYSQLAQNCGYGESTVRKHVDWLVKHGLVIKEKQMRNGRQIQNKYRLPIGVLVIQGAQIEQAGVLDSSRPGAQIEHPSNTIKDTPKDTPNCADAQEADMKVEDVTAETPLTKEQIVWAATKKGDKFTADGCAQLWRKMRKHAAPDNGFQAEVLVKEKKMLLDAYKRVGDVFPDVVWQVMSNWIGFCGHAEQVSGAFNCPTNPSIAFFVKYIEAAADFEAGTRPLPDDLFPDVQLTANKPLTKPNYKPQNKSKPMTPEEFAALQEELNK